MLENDRFEVLDITTRPTSEYVGLTFREMPIRGALIGAIVRDGQAVFPRSDDTLRQATASSSSPSRSASRTSRASCDTAEPATTHLRRRRPATRLPASPSTSVQRSASPGCCASTSASRRSCLQRLRSWYREPPWPFLAAGAIAFAAGFGLERLGERTAGIGFREGYLVVTLTWLLAAVFGAIPYVLSGEAQLDGPVNAFFESMSGFSTTGSTILDQRRRRRPFAALLAPVHAVARWDGDHRPRPRRAASAPRRRPAALDSEMSGPEMDPLAERIRRTARRLWLLYMALTVVLASRARRCSGSSGSITGWGSSRRSRWRSRRCRPAGSCPPRRHSRASRLPRSGWSWCSW